MPYEHISAPLPVPLQEMSKKQLRAFAAWYHDISADRISQLIKTVHGTPFFNVWNPDYSPESLKILGEWLRSQVGMRPHTDAEMRAQRKGLPPDIEVPEETLDDYSVSLIFDVSMYLGQVWIKNHPTLFWKQNITAKKYAFYGHPIIGGFGKTEFSPIHMVKVLTFGLADETYSKDRLYELYGIWKKYIVEPGDREITPNNQS